MSSGLTRRRGGGGVSNGDNEDGDANRVGTPTPKAGPSRDSAPETSYESSENGHKIAFDPRDMSESAERSKQPKLTMMEEVLLLGLKDKQVSGIYIFSIESFLTYHGNAGLPILLER
jgi:Golgi phosphoprotein 3